MSPAQQERFLTHRCAFCGAEPGEPCHTKADGKPVNFPHAPRIEAYVKARKAESDAIMLSAWPK